jgi:hypothetical protein
MSEKRVGDADTIPVVAEEPQKQGNGAEYVPHVTEVENADHWTNFMQTNWHTIGAYVILETIVLPWLAVSVEEKQVVRIITILMCMKMIGY